MCSCGCRHLQSLWPDPATVTWAILNMRNLIRTNLASDSYKFRPEASGTGPGCGSRKLWPCVMAGAAPRREGPGLSPAARRAVSWRSLWKHGIQLWTVTIKNNFTDTLGLFSEAVSLWPVLLLAGQCILLHANFQDTVTSFRWKFLQVWNKKCYQRRGKGPAHPVLSQKTVFLASWSNTLCASDWADKVFVNPGFSQ